MKMIIRDNISLAYSLHDMNVISFEIKDDDIIMRTQSGMVKTTPPYSQVDGYVLFRDVRWDYSYVYLLGVTGNSGTFIGEKLFLKDFIAQLDQFGFSIMDETYGYNTTKYSGYFKSKEQFCECMIELYHEGYMEYWTEDK